MNRDLIKQIKNYSLVGILYLAMAFSSNAYAGDIFIGLRGPTNFQADERIIFSKREDSIETLTNNLILKYWNGDEFGVWEMTSLSYKYTNSPKGNTIGFGDASVYMGPRGRINCFYWFLYGALTLPTGKHDGKVPLGNGRVDAKIGGVATYLTSDKKFEIDGSLEYNFTGKNKKGINSPNETSAGLLVGGKITDKIRAVTGLTDLIKDNGDFLLTTRAVVRYTISPTLHFELFGDTSIQNKGVLKTNSVGFFTRYNF